MIVYNFIRSMDPCNGGTVTACSIYNEAFKSLGLDSHIVSISDHEENENVYSLAENVSSVYGFSIKALICCFKKINHKSIIVVHGLWQFHGFLALLLSYFKKANVIVVPHGMGGAYFDQFKLKKLKKYVYWFFVERLLIKKASCIIYMGEGEKNFCSDLLAGAFSGKELIIRPYLNKVDTLSENFSGLAGLDSDFFNILFIGRDDPIKGLSGFLHELSVIDESCDFDICLNIIGPFSKKTIAGYLRDFKNIKINFFGAIYSIDKYNIIKNSDCVVVPSKYESFSLVALESLMMNTPVIVSNNVGITYDLPMCAGVLIYHDDNELLDHLRHVYASDIKEFDSGQVLELFTKDNFLSSLKLMLSDVSYVSKP
ncbi:glycosyltransferase [Neptunomonas qingdaonensis]|uniref:Glycosyltransferase involved in cell wall bisynthesis n=1 Tax=Neptunomonas qingdaonensis TaxID=1045558 RepID=A0A1I2VUQ3_9GAMM|nr:glycosyltransferase [Neptunomonas qingdaonensis]SFG92179.1 Glycosyltransferase involved in cell wall bisynthesis [Neptunomonas qingdaonensis]